MVVLDMDGTLINYDDVASPRVLAAVRALAATDVHVVLATGRGSAAAMLVVELFALERCLVVCGDGAVVFSHPPVKIMHEEVFDAGPAVAEAIRSFVEPVVAVEVVGEGYRVSAPFPDGVLAGTIRVEPLERLLAEPVSRAFVRDARLSIEELRFVTLGPPGLSKGTALDRLATQLGVTGERVLAIGDGLNDIPMLIWAGRGVAMGDAPDEVKNHADAVTTSLVEDGVAVELARWFDLPPLG
ncbi:HAD family hydrolase [Nocardioides sp.]|uniref:HAD family hydrolase n=1 Tax=Nocardioides sp. TaxID=35761 RepID=UPI0035146F64